jgi:hypothetical protein
MCNLCAKGYFVVAPPPAETAVSALCIRLNRPYQSFASLFAKREWVSGQSPENINKKKLFCTLFTEERFEKSNAKKFRNKS